MAVSASISVDVAASGLCPLDLTVPDSRSVDMPAPVSHPVGVAAPDLCPTGGGWLVRCCPVGMGGGVRLVRGFPVAMGGARVVPASTQVEPSPFPEQLAY